MVICECDVKREPALLHEHLYMVYLKTTFQYIVLQTAYRFIEELTCVQNAKVRENHHLNW